jgi:hypothetical protein
MLTDCATQGHGQLAPNQGPGALGDKSGKVRSGSWE